MVVMEEPDERGSNSTIAWAFGLCIAEIVLVWALASQFSYLVYVEDDASGTHVFLILGVLLSSILAMVTIGFTTVRASDRWSKQRCRSLFRIDGRLFYKAEIYILSAIVLGTVMGTGAWDIVTTINALVEAGWDAAVFYDDYLVVDMILFKVIWPLWLHTIVGSIKLIAALIIAMVLGFRVSRGTFCEA